MRDRKKLRAIRRVHFGPWLWLALVAALTSGCEPAPTQSPREQDQPPTSNHVRRESRERGSPGTFDYYVLALSWSPEFCHSHPQDAQCNGHFGFVVHGLWPQYVDGYPENCSTAPGLPDPSSMTDIMPDPGLVDHEWKTHGTCSGLDPQEYFKLVRQAFASVKIPEQLAVPRHMSTMTPQDLKEDFLATNPRLKDDDLAVSCGNNWLTGVSVCMDKQLQPRACEGVRDCRANSMKVAAIR